MAQTTEVKNVGTPRQAVQASNLAVAVAQAGNTDIFILPTIGLRRIFATIAVTGQNLDAFLVLARPHLSGTFQTLYSVAADYTSPKGLMVGASGDLTTLAAAATGWLILDVWGIDAIKLQASSGNVAGSTVDVYVGGM